MQAKICQKVLDVRLLIADSKKWVEGDMHIYRVNSVANSIEWQTKPTDEWDIDTFDFSLYFNSNFNHHWN